MHGIANYAAEHFPAESTTYAICKHPCILCPYIGAFNPNEINDLNRRIVRHGVQALFACEQVLRTTRHLRVVTNGTCYLVALTGAALLLTDSWQRCSFLLGTNCLAYRHRQLVRSCVLVGSTFRRPCVCFVMLAGCYIVASCDGSGGLGSRGFKNPAGAGVSG